MQGDGHHRRRGCTPDLSPGLAFARSGVAYAPFTTTRDSGFRSASQSSCTTHGGSAVLGCQQSNRHGSAAASHAGAACASQSLSTEEVDAFVKNMWWMRHMQQRTAAKGVVAST